MVLPTSLVVSLLSGRYIGSVAELARKELDNFYPSAWPVEPLTMEKIYKSITRTDRPRVFLDVTADEMSLGRIILELRGDVVPRTAENFRALCAGKREIFYVKHHHEKLRSIFGTSLDKSIERMMKLRKNHKCCPVSLSVCQLVSSVSWFEIIAQKADKLFKIDV